MSPAKSLFGGKKKLKPLRGYPLPASCSVSSLDEFLTDGNASFLRAARSGNVDKIIEHLKGNIDINTSNANGLNALHLAAKEGHVHIVTELLKRGANVNAATKKGNTALHIASLAGQAEVARMLVQLGAGVNAQSQNGFTPLYMAAQENHDDVVSFLLAHGANQSLATEDGFTPLAVALQQGHDKVVAVLLENDTKGRVRLPALHIAAKKDDCKAATLLLQSDHNPDVTSKSGFTPLHIAAHYGNENIAKILLEKGADVNYAAKHQITPLHVASKWGKMNMVLLLLEQGANIEASTRDGLTPLHCAARSGHDQVVDVLLEKGAPFLAKTKNGLAPLHMASQGDHIDSARILLYHKAPVDDVTVDYLTALHVAAHCGHVKVAKLLLDRKADANARALNGFTPLHIACKKNRIKVVELLLKHGASIEATTESGLTPLHVASFMGCMNIVIFLIQSGAHPDVPTVRGETPLHLAARANQTDIIRILLRNGASVDARAREDQTPLHIASRLGNVDIVSLLLQHGAAVDATTKDLYTALHIAAKEDQEEVASSLLDHGAALAATTKKGFTPLHLAAKYGNIKVARLLIQKSAAVDAQGKNGVTPLHVAAHYDHVNVALLLLDKGASPHATAKNGYTPLHIAAKKNQMDIASTLLEYGAKTNAESKAGFTPLHLSSQEGHVDMSSLLIENKADVNHKANNGLTPLHLCAQDDRVDVAHILVGHKAEIGPQTKAGYTPLHVASHFGQMNMVRFLLQHGANVHTTTSHGYTSLHQAAQQGHTLAVNLLLENQASPNVTTSQGQTPLSIAQRLGYISVVETLKVVTETIVTTTTTTVTEEKYKVVAPETMQETFMTDSEDEGGADFDEAAIFGKPTHATHVYLPYVQGQDFFMSEEAMLGDQSYGYLTADEMKSLGDDSLPIDVTKDEKHQDLLHNIKQFGAPMVEEDKLSPQHATPVEGGFSEKFSPDNIDLERAPMHAGRLKWKTFLVSFMVDARGGAMRGCRHSGVRVIIPPRKASMPMRITCRFLRREKLIHPPPLMEGEACASRILEMGPVGAKFLGPVIIEVPHFASTRGKEREITILRSDTGETWKEHTLEASEEAVQEVLNESFEGEELSALEDLNTNRITRILTTDFPQYFAIVTRVRQEVHGVGPEGGMVSSTVVPQVQAVFPEGALTKKIRVGLQAQPIAPELVAKLLGNRVAVSPIVTVEPRRRKFHKPITLTIPVPQATTKGMINQYSGDAPTLRLLCSITGSTKSGGSSKAQWEDVTGSTPLTFVNDCVSFTTTVSARFWLMDCRQVNEVTRFATELYQEAVYVPFMSKFVVFAKRQDAYEAQLRVFCMTDDREDKTLECQEHFTEIAKSRDVEVLEGKLQYLEFAGNIAPVTKSGEQLRLAFQAFHENRLPFTVRVRDLHAEPLGRVAFMREPKMGRGEPPQVPICNLNVALPETTLTEATSSDVIELVKLEKRYDFVQEAGLSKPELIHRADLRLSDIAQGLDKDWVLLARQLEVSDSDVQQIQSDTTCDQPEQALIMLRLWLQKSGSKATGNELEKGLRKINREDIIKNCMFNVELVTDDVEKAVAKVHLDQSGFDVFKEELGSSREASMRRGASLDVSYDEQDIMKDAESAAETSSETGSLFDKDQISHALTEDKVDEEGESSKNVADDENDAAVLFPKCKKSSSKHADAQGAENGDSQPGSPVDSRYHTEETNITQKHFVKTHDFWPPDKLVEINVTEIQTIQTDSSSDTSVKTQILNKYNDEIQNVSSPKEQLPSDFTNVCEPTIADTKSELTMDLLQKRDGEQSIDPSDFGYFSMDKDSNISPNTTSDNIKFVNVSQLPDVVAHECTSPTQNITTPFPVHSMHVDELGSTAMMQSSEIEQSPIPGTENIPENHSESVETSPIQNIYPAFPTQTVQTSVQNTATFHDTPDSDLVNQELSKEDCPSPIQSIPTPFPTHSMHVKELSSTGPMYSSVSEETSIQDSETVRDTPVISDNVLSDVSAMPTDQNRLESNSDSRSVCPAEIENVIHQTISGIITGNNSAEGNARFEDARIRRASKTPPPSPVDKPGKGGENLGKGVEILLSQSSLEEKLKETVDLANRSYDILGRDELQVRLTESETWPSLELDTSQVSISSLPDDEKSEPTTATASDAVADAAADKGITFVERIDTDEDFDDDALSPTKFKDLCSKKVSPTKSKMLLLTPEKLLNLQDLSLSPVKEVSEIETKETSTSPHSERTESIKPNQLISTRKGFRSRKRLSPINGSQKFEPKVPVRVDKGLSPIAVFTAGPSGIDKEESEYFVQTYDAPPMKTPESGKFSNKSTAMSPNTMFDAKYLKETATRVNELEESAKLKQETKQKERDDKTHDTETVDVGEHVEKLSPEKLSPEQEDNFSDASYIKVEKSLTESLLKVEKSTSPFSDLMLDTGIGTDSPVTADTASSPFLLDVQSPSSLTFQSREHCSTQTIQVEMLSAHTSPIDGPFSLQDSNLSFGQTESSLKSDSLDDLSKTLGTPSSDVAEPFAILETALLQQGGTPKHSMRDFLQEHVATDPSSFSETDDLPEASQEHSIEQTDDINDNDALNKILVIESFRNVFATEPPFAIVASKKESRSDFGKKKRSKFGVTGEMLGEDRLLTLHDQLLSEESALESSTDSGVDLKETSQNYAAPSDRIGGSPLKSKDRLPCLSTHSSMERHDSTDYSADASKTPLSEHQDILPDDCLSEIEKQILPSSSEYSEIQTDTVYMQDILESIEQTVQETENFQFKKPDKYESNNDDDDVCIAEDICIKAKAYSYTEDRVQDSHENERDLVKASDVIKMEKEISTNVISSSNVSQKEKKQSESFILEVEEQILSSTASRSFISPAEINQTFAQEILSNSAVEDTPSLSTVRESDFDNQSTVIEKPIVPKVASLDYPDPFDHSFQNSAIEKINIKPMVFRETELKFHVENQFSNRDELICHSSKTFSDLSNITDSKMPISKDVAMKQERKSVSHMEGTSFDTNWEQSYSTEAVFQEKSEYEGPGVTSVIKTTTQMTTYSSGAPGSEEEGGADALSLHSEKEKTISPDSPELEKLSFAEKRDFFQKLSETSSSNVTPTHTLKSTSEAEGISDTLVSEDMGSAESPDEQLSFKECLKFFEKSGDSPPSPKLEIKDIKKEVWTVVGEDSEKQRLDSMSDVSDIERERDMDVVEVQEKRRSTVSIDEQVSLPLYESKEAYDAVFDSTKDVKVEVVVKTFTPGSEMLEICSVENIPSDGEETHVKRVVSTHSITSQPAGGQSIESCKNIDEIIDAASDKDHSKSILHTIEETQAKSLNERDQSQLISESTHLADTQVKESDGSMHDDKFKDNSKPSDDENEVYTFSKCSKRESSTSLVASTEHDSRTISSSEAEKDTDSKSTTAPITEVKQGSETDKEKDSKTDISLEQHHEDVVSNEEFISRTFKTISESSYEVSKSTVGAFKNNTGDKVDNKWQRESPDNISIVKDTMEPSLGKSEIFICTEETLDNVKKILSVADAESNVVINENASTSATTQEELVESSPEVTSQAVVLDDGKISSEITQLDTSVKKEEKKSEGDVFICTEETASLSKKIISEVEKETEQFLTCITKKSIENKKEDVTDHEISNDDSNEVEIVSKSIFVVDTEIQPDSSTNKDIYTSISKSTSSSLELLDNGKGDSKEEIYISASEASLEDKPEKITINSAESENKISKEDILTEVVEEVSKTKIIDPKPLETSEDNIISIERVEKEFKVETTLEHISEQTIAKLGSDVIPKEISLEISKSDEIEEKSKKEVSDLLAGKETEAYRVGKFEDKKDVEEVLSDKVAEETIIPQSQPEETSEKEVEASEDKISDIESLKRKIQSEREIGLHFEENFAGSVGSNEEKSESCLSSVKDHSVEIEFLPNLEVTGDVSESGVDKTGHDASGTPCSFHKEMDFDDRQSDLGDSFEEIERNKIINDFKLENKSPNVEKAEFEEVEKKEQASSEEMIYKESLELQHRSGKETVHSVEVTQFTVDSTAVYNVPSEKLIEKFSSKRIHFESSKDGQEKSMAPHQMNQFLESMIDQGSSMTLPSDVTPVHKRTEEWIDQSEAILLREGPLIESSEMPMFDDRLPTTLEDEPHKRSSPTAESFDDKARVEQCDTDVMMQLMDFVSRNDIELAEVRTEDEAPDIEEDVSPTAEDEGSSRMTFEDPKSESRKDSKSKESLKVTDSEILLSSPQRSPYDSTNNSPSRKDIGSDTVETVVDGMKIREGSSPRMYPQSSLEVEVGSHDSEEVGTRDPDREMTPLSFVEEESHSKVDLNIRKTSSESQAIEAKQQTETDSSEVRELTSSKKTKPSGLGDSLEGEVVSAFESTVEKQVVQENLEEYIAGLSGERSQLHTLDSDQDFERLEKEVEESVVVEPQVHAQKLHEENLHTEEGEIVVKTVPCAFDNTAFAGAEVIDEVDQNEPIRARSPYEVIRDYEVPESSHIVTEQTKHEDLGTSKTTYEIKRVEEDTKGTTRTTYVSKQVEAIRHRPILQHIPSEISEEDLVEREIVSPISRRDSDVLDSPTEGSPKRVSGTHSYQEDDSNVFLSELPAGSGGLWDTSRVTQITTTRTTSRTVSEDKDSKTTEIESDRGILKESVTVTTTCQSITAPHEKESQPCLPTQQKFSSSEDARVLNGPGEVEYQPEYDLGGEIVQTRRSGGVYHTDRPLQISTSSSDEFKRRHYSSVSDDVLDSEIGDILRSGQQFDEDIIDRPMTPEPPIDEIEYGISISAKTLSDLTKLELDDDTIQRRVFPDFDDDQIASPPLSPDDSRAGFAYGMQFEKDVLDTVEEAMDMDSDPYSEEKEPVFDYGMRFEREPGLEDDDIRHYGDLYTHQEEDEDALENGDKVKIVAKSKRDSDFDILAGRKFFTKNVEMDELSMSSLQEFERLENELVSGRKSSVGSIDSLNGKPASKSGDHDDVSMSSLTEFERLEKECIEKEGINPSMQESTLSEIEEGHESQASETSQENKSDGCKDESSTAEGFDSHLEDIEKIILKTDSGEKEELSFQHLITQTTKSSGKTTDSTTTSMVSRMHVLQRSQDSFSKSDGRNDDIDQDSLHDELSLKPDSLADDTKHEYLDSLHEGRCDDADSLQGDMPDEMRDSLFEDRHLEDDSLRDMDILPDESSLSMESSLAAPLSHDEVVKEIRHSTQTFSKEERILEGTSGGKRAEIVVSELPKGDVMLSSTDSLEQSSSAAAAFHFESESAMSTSLTGHLQSEDNTMISSTDTLEHEGRITFRYEDIPIDDLEILIKDGRQVIVDSEGNVQTEYDVKHFLDNSADNINNEFKFCSKGFIQDTHPSGSMQVEKVMTSICYSGGSQGTETGPQPTGTFDTSYSDPEVEIEEIHTTDEFGNPKVIKKIKKVVQSRTQYTSSSSSANVEEKLKDFLREHAAGEGAGIGEELIQEERTIDDKGNVVVVRTVQQQVVSHPEVHSRTFTGKDADVLSEQYVERFKELDPTDDVCEYEKIDDQGNVVRVTQQVVIKPEVHSISFSGPDAHQQMEEYMKRFTPMPQNGSRTRAGETTYTGAQVSTATEQEYIPSESDSHDMGSTTYIKTTISNIVPESSEQFVVRTTTSTTVTSTDGTVKTNGSPEQKSSPKAD
ncbi:hypothetical protein JTE90_024431 [Oedothorax gibbosus]|uniref:Ankyrin-3 n=1 Tax=Oedothorax gibbosus TaxID=931172 RepID=A0AAV6UG26_9ARAC|nr:hypothetical protein JTE90_024431 [Oedothorax gibbosus]